MRPLLPPPSVRRRWRVTVLLAVGAGALLTLVAVALYLPRPAPALSLVSGGSRPATPFVQIDGYDLIVSYTAPSGADPHYFDSPDCGRCPLNLTPGSLWDLNFTLTNSDPATAHNVTSFTIGAPFSVARVSPGLPAILPPGRSLELTVTVDLPPAPGYYFLPGSIGAS